MRAWNALVFEQRPFVRQYGILLRKVCCFMPKGIPYKRYTWEFKQEVIETMMREKLSYREAARQFEIKDHDCIRYLERLYWKEGPDGL